MNGSNRQEPLRRAMIGDSPFGYFLRDRKTKPNATIAVEDEKKLRVSDAVGTNKTGKRLQPNSISTKGLKFKDHSDYSSYFSLSSF
jgi:hypothetical protein